MLYDPKWEVQTETKADPFSLEALIAWLEKQPANKTYRYECNGSCLLAQYFASHGFSDVRMYADRFDHVGGRAPISADFNDIAIARIVRFSGRITRAFTFGGALKRARDLAEQS